MFFRRYTFQSITQNAAHQIHHIPKARCEFFLRTPDFTERAWLQLTSDGDAKKWHQYPRSPTPTPLLRPNLPDTLLCIGHPQRVRPGRRRSDERRHKSSHQTRGEERGERRMAAMEEEEI